MRYEEIIKSRGILVMAGEWFCQIGDGEVFTPTQGLTGNYAPYLAPFFWLSFLFYRTINICTGQMQRIHNIRSWNHAIEVTFLEDTGWSNVGVIVCLAVSVIEIIVLQR